MGPSGPVTLQQATQAEDAADPNPSVRAWFQTFWAEYLAKLQLDDPVLMPTEPAKSTNQVLPMPPGENTLISNLRQLHDRTARTLFDYLDFVGLWQWHEERERLRPDESGRGLVFRVAGALGDIK